MSHIEDELVKRIHRDLQDDFDEELALELEDGEYGVMPGDDACVERRRYFRELFRLQSQMPCQEVPHADIELPARERREDYIRHAVPDSLIVPEVY